MTIMIAIASGADIQMVQIYGSFWYQARANQLGELCEEEEIHEIRFSMDQRVEGSGYANIRNVLNKNKEYLKSRESGSGTYRSEEDFKYHADLKGSAYAMDLSKSNLSVRYAGTSFSVTPKRSINNLKMVRIIICSWRKGLPKPMRVTYRYNPFGFRCPIHYRNYDLGARISSDYDGTGRIKSDLTNFRA